MHSPVFHEGLFQGQVALVTGGGTGIGAAIAGELARLGATVVIASRKQAHVDAAAAGLSAEVGRPIHGRVADIRDRDGVNRLASEVVETFGRIDVLINNGGGQFMAPAEAISPRGWDAVIQTNLTGTWNMTRAVTDAWMAKHGGSIVNITMLTSRGFPGMAHSVAARAGVEAMTRTLAVEWAQYGIRINCVEPGIILTPALRQYPDADNLVASIPTEIPLKRLGTLHEVACLAVFLASPAASYITGQTMVVDGGRSLWGNTWPIPDPPDMGRIVIPKEPWDTE